MTRVTTPASSTPGQPAKPTPVVADPEPEPAHDCYCHASLAPCSWCEDGGTCGHNEER